MGFSLPLEKPKKETYNIYPYDEKTEEEMSIFVEKHKKIRTLQDYYKSFSNREKQYPFVIVNDDYFWTYVEVTYGKKKSIFDFVKIYVPVKDSDVFMASEEIFKFLFFQRKNNFMLKNAH